MSINVLSPSSPSSLLLSQIRPVEAREILGLEDENATEEEVQKVHVPLLLTCLLYLVLPCNNYDLILALMAIRVDAEI